MVALNPAYFADVEAPLTRGGLGHDRRNHTEGLGGFDRTQPKNRVGDFFCEAHDCTESSHPAALILTIEIHLYIYDPASGCYKYLYAHANPVMFIDPSGNFQSIARQTATLTVMQTLAVHLIAGYYIYAFNQALVSSKLKRAFDEAQQECGNRECVQFAEKAQEILKNSSKKEGSDWEIIQYDAPTGALWLDGVFAVEGFGRFGQGTTDSERQVSENGKHVGIKILKGIGVGTISDNNILFAPEASWRVGYEVNPRAAGIMTIGEADSLKNYNLYGRITTTKSKDLN